MNSRERVRATLEHQKPDHIPVDFFEGFLVKSLTKSLMVHYGVSDFESLRLRVGIDIRHVGPRYIGPDLDDGISIFGSTDRIGAPTDGVLSAPEEFDAPDWLSSARQCLSDSVGRRPLRHATSVTDVDNHEWPREEWYDFSKIQEDCQKYPNHAVWLGSWSPIFSQVSQLCGIETTLVNLRRRPKIVHAITRHIVDFYSFIYEEAIKAAGARLDLVGYGDDFATQQNLMMSPDTWRTFFKQPLADLFRIAKKSGLKTIFHSCGAVRSVIPDLIEIGLDVLYPIQPLAAGMKAEGLKVDFGDYLSFYGGVDVQHLLPFGTPDDVQREVKRLTQVLGAGGGYILSSSHIMQPQIPPANVIAMYEEATKTEI